MIQRIFRKFHLLSKISLKVYSYVVQLSRFLSFLTCVSNSFSLSHFSVFVNCFFNLFFAVSFFILTDSLLIISDYQSVVNYFFRNRLVRKKIIAHSEQKRAEKEGFEPSRRVNDLHP